MSVVTVTDLIPGENAASADFNATVQSFNTATAAGALGGTNFVMEGLDRRPFPNTGGLVEQGTSATYAEDVGSGSVSSAAYAVIPLDGGANPMVMPVAITAPASAMLILHASVRVSCGAIPTTANLPRVWCRLEQSTDGGATYTALTGSERSLRMRDVGVGLCSAGGANAIPGINQTLSWAQYVATSNVATLYRVTYRTVNGSFDFNDGVITPEVILR